MTNNSWSYEQAFKRNLGLVSTEEQKVLQNSRVAILGMGGVGGIEAVTLARLGIGKFTIADPDHFEVANFNRQYGATVSALNQSKAEVMERVLKDINPEAEVKVIKDPIGTGNVGEFIRGANLFVDGVDAFAIEVRRAAHRTAREHGIFSITAGPLGMSSAWLVLDPKGTSFDDYFDLKDTQSFEEKIACFFAGLSPSFLHLSYYDTSLVNIKSGAAPSLGLACQLSGGVVGAEALKILLKRGNVKAAPVYHQFDAYKNRYKEGRLFFKNKGPIQMIKRKILESKIRKSLAG